MKRSYRTSIFALSLSLFFSTSYAKEQGLFQEATFTSLLQGVYDGDYSFEN